MGGKRGSRKINSLKRERSHPKEKSGKEASDPTPMRNYRVGKRKTTDSKEVWQLKPVLPTTTTITTSPTSPRPDGFAAGKKTPFFCIPTIRFPVLFFGGNRRRSGHSRDAATAGASDAIELFKTGLQVLVKTCWRAYFAV